MPGQRRRARRPAAAAIRTIAPLARSGESLRVPRDSRGGVVIGGERGEVG
jgi:hypothetical protein